jgi:hypothetical protein
VLALGASLNQILYSDGDCIADAWERQKTGNLTTLRQTSDFDGDGVSDSDE